LWTWDLGPGILHISAINKKLFDGIFEFDPIMVLDLRVFEFLERPKRKPDIILL
jgi:hypothetical protein